MIAQKSELSLHDQRIFAPSAMWEEALRYLDYVRELPEHCLEMIRIHTGLINGWPWFKYMGRRDRLLCTDEEKKTIKEVQLYDRFTHDIPQDLWLSEPLNDQRLHVLGIEYAQHLVNFDIIRYQTCMTNLYFAGIIDAFRNSQDRVNILEIGAGYGGLPYQFNKIFGKKICYFILDLPEMLFYCALFLKANISEAKIYLYERGTFSSSLLPEIMSTHDFVLLPNFIAETLNDAPNFHLIINLLSFQEMREDQVLYYADLGRRKLRGYFYSSNWARHGLNSELPSPLEGLFAQKFELFMRYNQEISGGGQLPKIDNILFNHLGTSLDVPIPAPRSGAKVMRGEQYELIYY